MIAGVTSRDIYLDDNDHIVPPERATRMIRHEYDENGRLIGEYLFFAVKKSTKAANSHTRAKSRK